MATKYADHTLKNILHACAEDALTKTAMENPPTNPWLRFKAAEPDASTAQNHETERLIEYDANGKAKDMNRLSLAVQGFKVGVLVVVMEGEAKRWSQTYICIHEYEL